MAIIDVLPGVEVTITVDGQALKEYLDADGNSVSNAVANFVEATSGKTFEIVYRVRKSTKFRGDCVTFVISVDGLVVDRSLVMQRRRWEQDAIRSRTGAQIPGGKSKKFEFVTMETVQDARMRPEEMAKIEALGCIKFEVFHKLVVGKSAEPYMADTSSVTPLESISEKALKGKALTQQIKFGETVTSEPERALYTRCVDPSGKPDATFLFNYRTTEALKSMLIIPRTPSPEPPTPLHLRDPTTLTPEEIVLLQQSFAAAARQNEIKAEEKRKIKRERPDDSGGPRKKAARPQAGDTLLELRWGGIAEVAVVAEDDKEESSKAVFANVEPYEDPYFTVKFCYRSTAAIKTMRIIIPRAPSPEPPTPLEDRDFTTLSPEDLREFQKRFNATRGVQAKQEQEPEVKQENVDREDDAGDFRESTSGSSSTADVVEARGNIELG